MKKTYLTKSLITALLLSGSAVALLAQNGPANTGNGQHGARNNQGDTPPAVTPVTPPAENPPAETPDTPRWNRQRDATDTCDNDPIRKRDQSRTPAQARQGRARGQQQSQAQSQRNGNHRPGQSQAQQGRARGQQQGQAQSQRNGNHRPGRSQAQQGRARGQQQGQAQSQRNGNHRPGQSQARQGRARGQQQGQAQNRRNGNHRPAWGQTPRWQGTNVCDNAQRPHRPLEDQEQGRNPRGNGVRNRNQNGDRTGNGGILPPTVPLEDGEAEAILFMKQEEKLARDVYLTLYAVWEHNTLRNISISEQRHMNSVDTLIEAYDLEDTTPEEIGEFTIPELQELFDQLIEAGSGSVEDALTVGVLIEETDIADLEDLLAATENEAIIQVMSNLLDGSHNHLAAFTRALEQLGVTPDPTDDDADTGNGNDDAGNGGDAGNGNGGPGAWF